MATATLKNYRQAPRKVRLVADLIRGKQVDKASTILTFAGKRAGGPIDKLLRSAVASALLMDASVPREALHVSSIQVDQGFVYKCMRPRAFGRGAPIHKATSHVMITVAPKTVVSKRRAPTRKVVA